jgi:hypothetical protein
MILSKLNNGAMGAAGNGVPEKATQMAWLETTREQSAGAGEWFVNQEHDSWSASMVREVPPRKPDSTDAPVYRLLMTCNPSSGTGEIQLAWSPQPQTGRTISISVDGNAPLEYQIKGKESMGNGATVQSGRASIVLSRGRREGLPLAKESLAVRDLFPGETVAFSFTALDPNARLQLNRCF